MVKACIIGISGYGRVHYDLLVAEHAAGNLAIVGATVINPAEEADACSHLRKIGCRIFDDYTVMLRELSGAADLCCIPTGIPLHRPMCIAALEAGMHVLVEKPVAGCMADAMAMRDAAAIARRRVAVGYQHMYSSAALAVKKHILDGMIGPLESIKCLVMWPRDHRYYTRNRWAGRLTLDGSVVNDSPFNNAVAHELMMMLFQAGAGDHEATFPRSVSARLYRANDIESCDTACLQIQTDGCVPLYFYATHASRELVDPVIQIQGRNGVISMTHKNVIIKPAAGGPFSFAVDGGGDGSRRAMIGAVLDAVQGGNSFICDLDIAMAQTAVVDMIHAACPIHVLKGQQQTQPNGTAATSIPGIEVALRRVFDDETVDCAQWLENGGL